MDDVEDVGWEAHGMVRAASASPHGIALPQAHDISRCTRPATRAQQANYCSI